MPIDREELLERQYQRAIEARDELNNNYHKWMTFYYVANGAILVAITALYSKISESISILFLAIMGVVVCILWNFSCKGYYYWSNSWIKIIKILEKKVTSENKDYFVYLAFSKQIIEEGKKTVSMYPYVAANISTPKLTLRFSFFSVICWTLFSFYNIWIQFPQFYFCCKLMLCSILLLAIICCYSEIPKYVVSRMDEHHEPIE